MIRALGLFAVGAFALALTGCGDGNPSRHKIGGTVKYKGEPVKSGTIDFKPVTDTGRAATGLIKDGAYTLSTFGDGDGALPGEYEIAITAKTADMSTADANQKKMGGSARQDDVGQAFLKAENVVPAKYSLPSTSGLKRTVSKAETMNFDLTE